MRKGERIGGALAEGSWKVLLVGGAGWCSFSRHDSRELEADNLDAETVQVMMLQSPRFQGA